MPAYIIHTYIHTLQLIRLYHRHAQFNGDARCNVTHILYNVHTEPYHPHTDIIPHIHPLTMYKIKQPCRSFLSAVTPIKHSQQHIKTYSMSTVGLDPGNISHTPHRTSICDECIPADSNTPGNYDCSYS